MPPVGAFIAGAISVVAPAAGVAAGTSAAFLAGASAATFLTVNTVGKLLLSVAMTALSQALATRPKSPRPGGIRTGVAGGGGVAPLTFILGRYATAGHEECPAMSHGKVGKVPNAYLTYVRGLGDIQHTAINRVIVDGEYVTLGADDGAGFGLPATGRLAGKFWVKSYDGSQTVADPSLLTNYGSYPSRPWLSDMIGRGIPYAVVTSRYKPGYWNGLPDVRFEVDGLKLYDVRLDTTAGGSGAQRWATPSTWAFTRNPMVMIYNILRGITLLDGSKWGGAVTETNLPYASWAAAMNVCDVQVALAAGGTEARYRAGFEVAVSDEPADVIAELLSACHGMLSDVGGVWKPRAGAPGLSVLSYLDEDIVVSKPQDFEPVQSLDQTYNAITATYPEPVSLWESKEAPPRYNTTWETEDGGRRLTAELPLPAVPYPDQVQRIMSAYIKDERRFRRHALTLPPNAAILEPGDTITWTSTRNGYSSKLFEVAEVVDDLRTLLQTVSVREVDPTDYDWVAGSTLPNTLTPSIIIVPADQSVPGWTVTGVSLTDSASTNRRPAIKMAWDGVDQDDIQALEYEIRLTATAVIMSAGSTHNVEAGQQIVAGGILPNTAYQVRGRFVVDRPRAWTAWTAVTTPNTLLSMAEIDAAFDDAVNGALDLTRFSQTIRPVEVLATLPATGNFVGRMVFLTSDDKLYRHTGSPLDASGFSTAVPTVDLTGQITTTQITDDAITTPKIVANAITATEIATNAITSGKIAADSVIAGKIAVGAVGASQIAAKAIVASHILVADFDNAYPDYDMVDPDFYAPGGVDPGYSFNISSVGNLGQNYLSINPDAATHSVYSDWFVVEPGADYRVSCSAWMAAAASGTSTAYLNFGTLDGTTGIVTQTTQLTIKTQTNGSSTAAGYINATAATDERRARFRFFCSAAAADDHRFGAPRMTRRMNAELIVDGSITSASLVTGSAVITGSAQIADLTVDTINIAGNAITIPSSAYTSGGLTLTSTTVWASVQSVTFTRTGVPTLISFSATADGAAGSYISCRLMRGATLLTTWATSTDTSAASAPVMTTYTDTNTGTGSTTYEIEAVKGTTADVTVSGRSLWTLHVKK